MNVRLKAKALVGLAATAMFVGLVGAPSGAGEILTADLVIDDLEFSVPSDPNPDNPCAEGTSSLTASYSAPGSFDVSALHIEGAFELTTGDWWEMEVDYLGTISAASVTGSNPYTVSGLDIVLGFTLVDVDDDGCTPLDDPCAGVVGLALDGSLNTTPSPDVASLAGGSASSAIGNIDIQDTSCGTGVGPYQGAPVVLNSLTAEVP